MESVIEAAIKQLLAGGPAAGWVLAAYLLLRLHQLTDRQHKANLDTVKSLVTIKTVLLARFGIIEGEGE